MCTFHSYLESPFFEEKRIVSNRFSISFLYAHSLFAHGLNAFRDNNRQLSFIRVNIFIESDNCQSTRHVFCLISIYPTACSRLFNMDIGKSGHVLPRPKSSANYPQDRD